MSKPDWTDEPTNEYSMRHAANELVQFVNRNRGALPEAEFEAADFAYKQLLRGANMVRELEEATRVIAALVRKAGGSASVGQADRAAGYGELVTVPNLLTGALDIHVRD